jgi:RNA 2',3'-cyclic 3'-phosphodiesterase
MPRLFIAIDLPPELRNEIRTLCVGVNKARWAKHEQLHVTLRFLGDTTDEATREIRKHLTHVSAPAFDLSLRGVGIFPEPRSRKHPRVLWLGIEPIDQLVLLKRAIDGALEFHEQATKQDFSPHLTVARFPEKPDTTLSTFLAQNSDYRSASWHVPCFRLYQSTLHPSGAVHEPLERYDLAVPGLAG